MENATLKCIVRYNGAPFAGWQRQPGQRTVQGEIEGALSRIANSPIAIQGAGRTDAGVHALGQVFSCQWPGTSPSRLAHAVSCMLAPDIHLVSVEAAQPDFNARFDAQWKRYVYAFDFGRVADPFSACFAWHVPYRVDLDLMRKTLTQFVGAHDFAGFQSAGSQIRETKRTIYTAELLHGGFCGPTDNDCLYRIELTGDGFLYKMVRNICGTLVEVARGRFTPAFAGQLLAAGDVFRGHCAPPHGLALATVSYDPYPGGATLDDADCATLSRL